MRTPWGERILQKLEGRSQAWLAREAQVSTTGLGEVVRKAMPAADTALRIAQALGVSVDWLITGREPARSGRLLAADEADWVELPRYDLRAFTDHAKPEPIEVIPVRRDWLYNHARRSKGLWLADLPTSKFKELGQLGDTILCQDLEVRDGEGYFLYFYDGAPLVRHFVHVEPPAADRSYLQFDEEPLGMRLAARILGTFGLRPA